MPKWSSVGEAEHDPSGLTSFGFGPAAFAAFTSQAM
jgi:hypothetical protein